MKAYMFPGQGAQFTGMGTELLEGHSLAGELFAQADDNLGFRLSEIMFHGSEEDLRQTRVTQPAIFLHSVISARIMGDAFRPDMVAGHSLGEFSALVAAGCLSFEDGLRLVQQRAQAMQQACDAVPGTMAAVLGLADEVVEEVCGSIDGVVVAANYNCPGQLVISGEVGAVEQACEQLKGRGAKRALLLNVGGAFHSPLMEPAREQLAGAIAAVEFRTISCPVYQNTVARAVTDPTEIRQNLIDQLTAPVRWTQSVQQMVADGATHFREIGPGKVLQGLLKKIDASAEVEM